MNYKISTIMPVYNSEKYLSHAIESLLNQTYKNIEIIIVDDGSTDNSLEIIKQYAKKDSRIKWFHQKNKGGNVALNFGISKATGDLIHFLDSDDYIELNAYEIIVNEFSKYPEIDVCMFSYNNIDANNNITWKRDIVSSKTITNIQEKPELLIRYPSAQWMKIAKKELIIENNIIFDNAYFGYDVLFHLNVIQHAKHIIVLPNNFVYYRISNPSSSSGLLTRSKYYEVHFDCFKHCVSLYQNQNATIREINLTHQFEILIWYLNQSIEKYSKKNKKKLTKFIKKLNKQDKIILTNNDNTKEYIEQ